MIILIIIFTGCQKSANIIEVETVENSNKETQADEQFYEVSNQGGVFSNEDLIYFIMTDRFFDGDESNNPLKDVNKNSPKAYHGGDLKGVIEKLDYIKSLGTTALWITPVAENTANGYHGYWINDFYRVDPHLGTMDDLKYLVQEAHRRDIKVMLDYVVNHTSPDSQMVKEKPADWFNPKKDIANWNNQEEIEKGWIYGLPDLNQDQLEVKSFLIENALWWIEETDVDGMRLDTVKHVPKSFWNAFAYAIKAEHPDFYLLGEVWNNNPRYLEQYHQLGIDGMTDYPLYEGIRNAFTRFGKADTLTNAIEQRNKYSNPEINGIFVDNHDNSRLITYAGENGYEYLKQALTFIMTYPSIPIIYYGTEIAMEGGEDPDNRRDMDWASTKDSEMLTFYKKLAQLRSSNRAIKEGSFELLDHDSYFFSYMREKDEQSIVIVMNLQSKEKNATVNIPMQSVKYENILKGKVYDIKNNKLEIVLQPFEILILESR
jgi:alpha-amylase